MISGVLALLLQAASPAPACGSGSESWPTKKWEVTAPADLGFDSDSLQALVERARLIPGVTSLLVVRHGQIALETYLHGGGRNDPAPVASITKSVTSYLVGIALERGLIDSLDEPLVHLLPALAPPAGRPAGTITIRELLTMTSGLSEGWYLAEPTMLRTMSPPGSTFRYSNEAVQLLIRALTAATGENAVKYSREVLWNPLGIDVNEDRWFLFEPKGLVDGAAGLKLTARELGKLGLLALHDGCWEGKQVVPADYLRAATTKQVAAGGPEPGGRGYGFLWWITPRGVPYMAGQGGNYVVVRRDLDLVAVITARTDAPHADYDGQFRLVSEGVAGALRP